MRKKKASSFGPATIPASWVVEEFSRAQFPDQRLLKRAQQIMTQFGQQPTATIPQACGWWSDIKAAYRFFDNDALSPEMLLAPHTAATAARMQRHEVVLAVQDTTTLNYSTHPDTAGLGPIGRRRDQPLGLLLHTTLALSATGQPLGILAAAVQARAPEDFGRSGDSGRRNRTAIKAKESQRWLDSLRVCQQIAPTCAATTLINIADREGDIYELLAQALRPSDRPVHVLVRAQHNRRVESPHSQLWAHLRAQPVGGRMQIRVPRQPGQAARMTTLRVRWSEVILRPPCLKADQPPLKVWALEASEEHPPKDQAGILWRLLTTLPVATAEQAMQRVRWYAQRWQIEVFHKVLKSGCKIEQRQLATAPRLKRVLMLDLIVAWRVLLLNKAARETPEQSADQWLREAEWKVLWCYMNPGKAPLEQAPGLRQAVRWIGQLGGFIARKADGEPGPMVLWRGLQRLKDLAQTWETLKNVGNA